MARTVIIAIDNSDYSEFAFDFYIDHVMHKSDKIVLVHVSEYTNLIQAPSLLTDPVVMGDLIMEEVVRVKQLVNKYSHKLRKLQLAGKVKHMGGETGEAILAVVREEGADLIVLGRRGMNRVSRMLIGSVSEYLIHNSQVPVLICHTKQSCS